jgi:hypothetical protein
MRRKLLLLVCRENFSKKLRLCAKLAFPILAPQHFLLPELALGLLQTIRSTTAGTGTPTSAAATIVATAATIVAAIFFLLALTLALLHVRPHLVALYLLDDLCIGPLGLQVPHITSHSIALPYVQ